MISASADILIERPAEPVFRFVVLDFFENYQRWSPEVEYVELLSPGPICVGGTGRQVRVDQGRRTDTTFTIVALEPPQCLEFVELGERYRIRYALEPVPLESDVADPRPSHTRLIFSLKLKRLSLIMRPFETLIRTAVQEGAERMVESIKGLVESEVLRCPSGKAA